MSIPNKIYIPLYPNYNLDGHHLGDDWMYEPQKDCKNVEYINKNILLEELLFAQNVTNSDFQKAVYQIIIDRINSI